MYVGEEIIICKKYHTLKCHDICINNVKPDATFEIIGMYSCISPLVRVYKVPLFRKLDII